MIQPTTAHAEAVVAPAPRRRAVLISANHYRGHSYGPNHPLGIPRVALTVDLIRSYGALLPAEHLPAREATDEELAGFHTRAYVQAMRDSERQGRVSAAHRARHNIGVLENPYFARFFTIPATATGASVQAAEEVLAGRIAFNPAGGMHHALPDRARGFCYFNDPVLGILRLRAAGARVLYLDIDAHHGDGVEQAFAADERVLTVSLHMDTAYAYPRQGGGIEDRGPLDNAVNLPLPQGMHDAEYRHAFGRLWPAVLERFRPDAVVLQAGTDILTPDPLGRFRVSTQCFVDLVRRAVEDCPRHADGTPRLLALGGGGYHPLAVARCWTGVWEVLSGRTLPAAIPPQGEALLRAVDWDLDADAPYFDDLFVTRADPIHEDGIRPEIDALLDRLFSTHPLFRTRQA